MNKHDFNKIIETINNIWLTKYIKTDGSKMHEDIFNLAKDINEVPGVTNTVLGQSKQVNYTDFDGDKSFLFEYDFLIEINNINLNSKIKVISTNNYGYNIVLCLNNDNMLKESYDPNKFSIKNFIKELKTCKSFDDIKRTFKRYAVEAIAIGTLMTAVLCNFTLSDSQIYELGTIDTSGVIQADPFYDYSEDPDWKLLCSDTEATVYHAVPEQCNNDVKNTASMFRLNLEDPESHKIIAMERTMMKQYGLKYGDLVKIEGAGSRDGVYQIQDTMNKRFAGKHKIDFLINLDSKIGKWNNVKVYKLMNPDTCYQDLKMDMANALNQESVNRRQQH
jgi:hypothetical protein